MGSLVTKSQLRRTKGRGHSQQRLWCDIPKRVLNGINGHPGHWEVEAGMGMYGSEMDNFYILFRSSLMCAHALSKTN